MPSALTRPSTTMIRMIIATLTGRATEKSERLTAPPGRGTVGQPERPLDDDRISGRQAAGDLDRVVPGEAELDRALSATPSATTNTAGAS